MRRTLAALLLALAVSPLAHADRAAPPPATPAASSASGLVPTIKPRVEIVFALDTTGSMGGLIDGAKRKIWSIANEVASASQKPDVRIGLVAYRDRGDAYVTEVTPLTDNLDAVYEKLMALRADGGGDGPEDVNSALDDAVNKMQWSEGRNVLRMVFLVGDAPPHMDYEGQRQWQQSASAALRRNVYINTVQCGVDTTTTTIWRDIAHAAEGRFAAIPQDGGVRVAVATPFDGELGRLAGELDATSFTYGRRAEQIAQAYGLAHRTLKLGWGEFPEPARIAAMLAEAPAYTHCFLVHHETTTGMLNPLAEVSAICRDRGVSLIVDAMSSLGGVPLDVRATPMDYVISSANKCLQGMPGLAFVLVEKTALVRTAALPRRGVYLDLHAQWRAQENERQFLFTPPVQVLNALVKGDATMKSPVGPLANLDEAAVVERDTALATLSQHFSRGKVAVVVDRSGDGGHDLTVVGLLTKIDLIEHMLK
jgi:Mg-chelatase subunit ChlD